MTNRIAALAKTLTKDGISAYFACMPNSMGYLTGLFEDGHERLLIMAIHAEGQFRLICPALTANQASRIGITDVRTWTDGEDPFALMRDLAEEWNLKAGIIAVDNEMRADILLGLQDLLPAALFKAGEPTLSQLMRRKDGLEVEALQLAASIADQAYQKVKPLIKVGLTEIQVGKMLADAMSELGGKPTFSIVAAGANGAEPHHVNDETILKSGDVVILDFGCEVQNYQSDITRTVAMESASKKAELVYDAVYRAHMAARTIGKAGVEAGVVDAAARRVIDDAGYGPYFVHRTGHGLGMNIHEAPNITPGSEFTLEDGNCFSVEPGIYLPGEFGVRIENIVMSRHSDCYSFNEDPSPVLELVG